ncbi:MAG TPA: type II secretion system F family protein [Sedimenticola thiotaurini]|uniref:Type II secretion system F family protein n=1 Tax=Sedimenticola thiotaurini TaxID=1543721 RepID=A0A831RK39_9GAMM|nr:type II secretion system F family protein [Sedimenticola thiotaurini]
MPLFRYRSIAPSGELTEGEMQAAAEAAVISHLKEIGHLPVRVEPTVEQRRQAGPGLFRTRRLLTRGQLAVLTRELARLVGAGVSLERSLGILEEVAETEAERLLLLRLVEAIRAGSSFADAVEAEGAPFGRLYVSMVRAGEEGGALPLVLDRLAGYLEESQAFRADIGAALIYPVILLLVSVVSLVLLLTLVVPQFQRMFDEAGALLPLPTRIVIALGDWMQQYWWTLPVLALVGLLGVPRLLERPRIRLAWDRFQLRLPLLGPLIRKIEVARFCRTLATLLGNGVLLLPALGIVRETLGNRALAESVGRVAERLKRGETLSGPMLEEGRFPRLACHMVRVGEETGRLETMLVDVADIYDREVRQGLKKMLGLLEPLLILVLGVLIAGIIFSILLALLSLNELAF